MTVTTCHGELMRAIGSLIRFERDSCTSQVEIDVVGGKQFVAVVDGEYVARPVLGHASLKYPVRGSQLAEPAGPCVDAIVEFTSVPERLALLEVRVEFAVGNRPLQTGFVTVGREIAGFRRNATGIQSPVPRIRSVNPLVRRSAELAFTAYRQRRIPHVSRVDITCAEFLCTVVAFEVTALQHEDATRRTDELARQCDTGGPGADDAYVGVDHSIRSHGS